MRKAIIPILLALLLVAGCAAAPQMSAKEEMAADSVSANRGAAYGEAAPASAPVPESPEMDEGAGGERMIIRTVDMRVVVEDTDVALANIRGMADAYGGYVADSNRWLSDDQPYASITVRIPAESLDEALDSLRSAAIKVENESSSGQDVTEEYVDVDARLRNLEATETELLELLTEVRKNRGDAEEILAIHRELTSIRSQIESLKGRKTYLERMTALATLRVEIRPKAAPRPVVEPDRWNPLVTASNAARTFVRAFESLADLLIYLLILSPFVLIPVLVIWLLARAVRKRKENKATDEKAETETVTESEE